VAAAAIDRLEERQRARLAPQEAGGGSAWARAGWRERAGERL
jgi:hypothetical protein